MTYRWISPESLWLLNTALDRDPELRKNVLHGIEALAKEAAGAVKGLAVLEPEQVTPVENVPEEVSKTAELTPLILAWFQRNGGRHALSAAREHLGVPPTSKPFKTAVANLVADGKLRHSEKRGRGSEYWLA